MNHEAYRFGTLGRTGLRVGRLGIGSSYGAPTAAIEAAYDQGCNYLYWGSMRRPAFGRAIRNICQRDRDGAVVVLQSYAKVPATMPWGVRRGLKRLKLDHADILLLGWIDKPIRDGLLNAALRLKEQGLVRFIAQSTHHRPLAGDLVAAPPERCPFDALHVRYNAAHRGAEAEVFDRLPRDPRAAPGLVTFTTTRWGTLLRPSKAAPEGLGPPSSTDCYRFALSNPAPSVVLCGPGNQEQMDLALAALEAGPMSEDEMVRMRAWGDAVYANPPFRPSASVFSRF